MARAIPSMTGYSLPTSKEKQMLIHCPHWECSRDFRSERALFDHYLFVHDGVVTDERAYYNNLRNTGDNVLTLALIETALYTSSVFSEFAVIPISEEE